VTLFLFRPFPLFFAFPSGAPSSTSSTGSVSFSSLTADESIARPPALQADEVGPGGPIILFNDWFPFIRGLDLGAAVGSAGKDDADKVLADDFEALGLRSASESARRAREGAIAEDEDAQGVVR